MNLFDDYLNKYYIGHRMEQTKHIYIIRYDRLLQNLIKGLLLLLPFSIPIDFGNHQLEIPNEPLLIMTSFIGLIYAYREQVWKLPFFRHPLFLASSAYIGWTLVTTLFSNHFYVSVKYVLVGSVHWWVYFCLAGIIFSKTKPEDSKIELFYIFSFISVLLLAWFRHGQYGFSFDTSVFVARPFYFDHALYSCAALLLLGFSLPYWWQKKAPYLWFFRTASLFLLLGVYFSYSRAAWLSMIGAFFLTIIIACFKPHFKTFLVVVVSLVSIVGFVVFLLISKKENQVLSKQGSSWQHLQSTINVSTDVSNLERLDRYSCAWRMFKTKPVLGYGPGNFIIDYYPFQKEDEMTRLSVRNHGKHRPGKGGGAHSEYLQALSEMGFIGLLAWLVLILTMIYTVVQINIKSSSPSTRLIVLGLLFGLLTFFIHSLFNNLFHHEKVSALVWLALATLVHKKW